jgi:hypothetical protein
MPKPDAVPPAFGEGGNNIKERLDALEWVASIAAGALFLAIIGFLTWGTVHWPNSSMPRLPNGVVDKDAIANLKAMGEVAKAMSDIEVDRMSKVIDLSVTKTLLPVFTTVIGYLLGKRG